MKKILLAAVLAVTSLAASANPQNRVHYHEEGEPVYSNRFAPVVETTYERDNQGRRIRVETTVTCTNAAINRRNNHLRCLNEEVTARRFYDDDDGNQGRPTVEPVVYRSVERDQYGRRVIVTTTYNCVDSRWNPERTGALCFQWSAPVVEREMVRRQPRAQNADVNGDGRVDPWERLILEAFRDILDND